MYIYRCPLDSNRSYNTSSLEVYSTQIQILYIYQNKIDSETEALWFAIKSNIHSHFLSTVIFKEEFKFDRH